MSNSTMTPLVRPKRKQNQRSSALLSRLVIASPFSSAWIALVMILAIGLLFVPNSVTNDAFRIVLPLTAFLAIASVGQMLVIMTGGIDLSVPSVVTMAGTVLLGLSGGADDRLVVAVLATLLISALIGLVNGVLVSVVRLNPLIVTLSVGGMTTGLVTWYRGTIGQESSVPNMLSEWCARTVAGISPVVLLALAITVGVALVMRFTLFGRRFQAVGGNPRAARVAGIPVRRYQVAAYTAAGCLYGITGLLLAAFVQTPNLDLGAPYLLGPIAAVVVAGASLRGGTASALATFAAAFFLVELSQMLRIIGLSSAWQFLIFGAAIAMGVLISGDRILAVVGSRFSRDQGSMVWQVSRPAKSAKDGQVAELLDHQAGSS
jgi:ribose transport system permease protein